MKNLLGLNEDYQLDLKSSKKLSEEHVLEIDTRSEEDLELMEDDGNDSDEDEDDTSEKVGSANSDSKGNEGKGTETEEETPPDDTEDKKGSAGSGDSVNFSMKLDGGFDKRVLSAKTAVDIANILRDFLTKMSTEAKVAQ